MQSSFRGTSTSNIKQSIQIVGDRRHIKSTAHLMKNSLFAAKMLELNFSETLTGRNIQKFLSLLAPRSILRLKLHYFTNPNN